MSRHCKVNKKHSSSVCLTQIAQFVIVSIFISQAATAQQNDDVIFNSEFMRSAIDVSAYSQGNPVASGNYTVDLYVNEKWKVHVNVEFAKDSLQSAIARPCFNIKLISMAGIDLDKISPEILQRLKSDGACVRTEDIYPDLVTNFDVATQRINVQSPQIYLQRHARGYVSPELWDNGITAAMLQYDYNVYHSDMSGSDSLSTQYLGLRGGINWDVWRLRYRGAFNWNEGKGWGYDNANTYLERAIVPLRSKLVVGESSTDGQVFDSVGFRGVLMASDDRMYMDSQRGYAPIINGIARLCPLIA